MDITFTHLITDTLTLVDTTTASFVHQAYSNLSGYINGLVMLSATLYIMHFGYEVLYQKLPLDTLTIARYLTLLTLIIMLTTRWEYYNRFIYTVFTHEPDSISAALSSGKGTGTQALNQIWLTGSTAASDLLSMANLSNPSYYLYGTAVYVATFAHCLYALGLLVYAKMGLAIILALGQLFLLMMLWKNTRELTSGWVRGLLYFACIPVITTAILLLTNTLAQKTLPGLQGNITQGIIKPAGLFPYIALAIVNYFLLKQTLTLASLLSGSVSLEALDNIKHIAHQGLKTAQKLYKGGQMSAKKLAPRPVYENQSPKQHRQIR